MKKSSAFAGLLLAMLAVHQLLAVRADVVCSDLLDELSPCLGFVQGDDEIPSSECCAGVSSLVTAANTVAERQATCECLKSAYGQINADLSTAQALPADCGVTSLPYTISPDVDCST
ncbi:hypothetical protein PR202_gb27627 [Eleusine coracana subsp. coracana]|uniref:Non-specific lipid-transfer protein n=1 Tax=Eleusine coracana subsp. coracana TaxID=191504 RepID=A0AAV5FV09_ELECO|nr:hypothetical protein PR202_gb27627 [Eleusine coracana subsp. coracana]